MSDTKRSICLVVVFVALFALMLFGLIVRDIHAGPPRHRMQPPGQVMTPPGQVGRDYFPGRSMRRPRFNTQPIDIELRWGGGVDELD